MELWDQWVILGQWDPGDCKEKKASEGRQENLALQAHPGHLEKDPALTWQLCQQ